MQRKARALVTLGEDAERIEAELKEFAPVARAADMADAVRRAYRVAEPGDTVLLAPGVRELRHVHELRAPRACLQGRGEESVEVRNAE